MTTNRSKFQHVNRETDVLFSRQNHYFRHSNELMSVLYTNLVDVHFEGFGFQPTQFSPFFFNCHKKPITRYFNFLKTSEIMLKKVRVHTANRLQPR